MKIDAHGLRQIPIENQVNYSLVKEPKIVNTVINFVMTKTYMQPWRHSQKKNIIGLEIINKYSSN